MAEWWNALGTTLQVLYCITLPATVILVIQTILLIIGFGDSGVGVDTSDVSGLDFDTDVDFSTDTGFDTDTDGLDGLDSGSVQDGGNPGDLSAMHLLTVQTVIAFLTVFGWSTIVSLNAGGEFWLSALIGAGLGLAAMLLIAKLVQLSAKLASDGTMQFKNALGASAVVYLPIPANGAGHGKVTLTLQGSFTECDALCLDAQPLPVGTAVRVIDVREETLVVERED